MAALLHDAGHMPFSHQFEESNAGKKMLSDGTIIKTLWNGESLQYIEEVPDKMSHEHYSIQCAIKILNDVKNKSKFNFEICDVVGMMENAKPKPSDFFCNQAFEILKIFSKVPELIARHPTEEIGDKLRNLFKDIISGEIDADKMDYLLRDSYFSGCNYGVYNIDHLVNNICIGYDPNETPPWVGIALDNKGLGGFEDFVYSRFRMYLQVYNHKTVIGLKWLVREAIAEILTDEDVFQAAKLALSDMSRFTDFTDTYCWEAFRRFALRNQNSACAALVNRKILNHIVEIKDQAPFEKVTNQIDIEKKTGKKIIYDECSSRFSKITPAFDRIRLLIRDDISSVRRLESIPRHSSFFSKFTNVTVTHYYEAPEWYKMQ
jgi:HD superfamily phosphohydrolase